MEVEGYVKPRFDGGGTEFGRIHRLLGPGYLMFDIDRLHLEVALKRENEGFIEYRYNNGKFVYKALIELKKSKTKFSLQALDPHEINSLARIDICKRLECRLFVAYGTEGHQPFEFFEINIADGSNRLVGILEYDESNVKQQVDTFYRDVLKIYRY